MQAVVVHVFNSSTEDAEAGGALQIKGQPGLHGMFQDNQGYIVKTFLRERGRDKEEAGWMEMRMPNGNVCMLL